MDQPIPAWSEDASLRSEAAAITLKTPVIARPRPRLGALLRPLLFGSAAIALLTGAGLYAQRWWTVGRFIEGTDDAYLQSDSVTISPRVTGYISEVGVGDNQRVKAGQVLARIDDRDFRAALDKAHATVENAAAQIRNIDAQVALQQSTIAQQNANIEADEAALTFADQDYRRYANLARTGAGTVQSAQRSASDIREKAALLQRDRAGLAAAEQQVDVLKTQRTMAQATLAADRAAEQQAALNLSYTVLTAPVDGTVGDRSLRLGQYVQPGTALMQVVPMASNIYVVANFKETQLAHMVAGEKVAVDVDTFPDHTFEGTVDSLSPGSGSQFALLPPENATGNFTKIVQRVPVKIRLDPTDPLVSRLRPGLSVEADVDTRSDRHAGTAS
ncbi:MAG TPA: HlyD family secretion protein [Acetobacteraceae bacterium]|nr:HlyD family secretion protein [Acetobacteraceae bacterium]